MTKLISILVPTYNEQDNACAMYEALTNLMKDQLSAYDYEIVFIDNKSTDNTRLIIRQICTNDKRVKAIFNTRNFGFFNSPFYGLLQCNGDCVVSLSADFQEPINLIPMFIKEWEKGNKIVCGVKKKSHTNPIMHFLRGLYYKLLRATSTIETIEHFTGFGLYDREYIEILKELKDPTPFYRALVPEIGLQRKEIEFVQPKRRAGRTSTNWYILYDGAMLGLTSYTKIGLRIPTILGFILSIISVCIALFYLVMKLVFWSKFTMGIAPILIGVFFFGSLQLFFIGMIGEYILAINERTKNRPLVIEEERLNF
jgi:glycosyltransferase involved in cell wall biosynthesis